MKAEWAVASRRLVTLLIAGALLAGCGASSPLASSTTTALPTTTSTTTTVPPTTTTTVAPKKKPVRKGPIEVRRAVRMTVYDNLATIPPATLAAAAKALPSTGGLSPTSIHGAATSGKPTVVVVGAEWCPYCAAENWSLVIALSQFGTFKDLKWTDTTSSPAETYRSIPGFTFYRSSYASSLLRLDTDELATVAERRLQRPTSAESRLMSRYDKLGGIPFVYLGGAAYLEGSGVSPKLLVRHTFGGAANGIVQGTSPLARSVEGNAGVIISYLCRLTHGQPGRICKSFPKPLTS
jgi:thiol-disulfide isomerase/thioredoxin